LKTYLVITQIVYLLFMIPWLFAWGISFMSFDQGFHWSNVAFVAGIGIYPIAAIVCSIFAWRFRKRSQRAAIILNLMPMIWILGLGIPIFFLNFS
jgi:hypothetical protein